MVSERFIVEPEESGVRLDLLVARRLDLSRSLVQKLAKNEQLLVGGVGRGSSYKVRSGDSVEAQISDTGLRSERIEVPIVFEDEYLLVADKPAGLVVHPGAGNPSGTLVNALLDREIAGGEDSVRPGVVHRLDRDTSGLIVLVKGEPAYSGLVGKLSRREVRRVYRAVVVGVGLPPSGTIEAPVGRDPENPVLMAAGVGKPAVTHFEKLRESDRHSMLRVRLETGRTHQIRVHFSAIGHPVYADPLYGEPVERRRLWLHAERLAFVHPVKGRAVEFESPIPEDLLEASNELKL